MVTFVHKPHRPVQGHFMIDTNSINARGKDDDMTRIEGWSKNQVVEVIMADDVVQELQPYRPGARKGAGFIYTIKQAGEEAPPEDIRQIVFPEGYAQDEAKRKNQENDVRILASARKHGRILITKDGDSQRQPGGMLGHATELANVGIRVMHPSEAVAFVERLIAERDRVEHEMAELTGGKRPDWVGKD